MIIILIQFGLYFPRFPSPILPSVSQWEDMLSTAFSLAIVGYVINLAMGRTLAAKHGYDVDPNQVEELHRTSCFKTFVSFCKYFTFPDRKCWLSAAATSWALSLRSM